MKKGLKSCLIVLSVLVGLCVIGVAVLFFSRPCPPQGPWPMPPWCGGNASRLPTTAVPTIQANKTPPPTQARMVSADLTVTVPYWTTGDVYLGIGENPTYLKLEKIDEVTYRGSAKIEEGVEYYYSRGSLATKSTTTFKTTDVPSGLNAVVDWADSTKQISMPGFQKGVLFGGSAWHPEDPGMDAIVDYNLDLAKKFGVEWLVIDNMWFEFPDCSDAQQIKPFYIGDGVWPDTQGWTAPTKTDQQMKDLILKAKQKGFKIFLKPVVVSFAKGPGRDPACHLKMTNWDNWFKDYTTFAVHFAKLAQETGVDMYSFGTELDIATDPVHFHGIGPSNPTARWRKMIKEIRKAYTGKLTFSVSCSVDANKLDFPCNSPDGVKFWDDLDYIGFEPYFSITTKPNPSIADIKEAFGGALDSPAITRAKQLSEKYNKPIVFTEFSLNSYQGATHYQLQRPANSQVDLQEQANQFEGIMQAVEERPWIAGMHVWSWYLIKPGEDLGWQLKDVNGDFNGKPGGQVLKKWYLKIQD
jgi:Glycoside Hydrolase Family 113